MILCLIFLLGRLVVVPSCEEVVTVPLDESVNFLFGRPVFAVTEMVTDELVESFLPFFRQGEHPLLVLRIPTKIRYYKIRPVLHSYCEK